MSPKPFDSSVLLLADPISGRIALGQSSHTLIAPCALLAKGDGDTGLAYPKISKPKLGCDQSMAPVFQDAALRALFLTLGHLIARPVPIGTQTPKHGEWGRLGCHFLVPDRAALTYLGRVIDPVDSKKRRHRRVFTASVSKVCNSIQQPGQALKLAWVTPDKAIQGANDEGLEPFMEMALKALGGRPRPLKVSFRSGQRIQSRL